MPDQSLQNDPAAEQPESAQQTGNPAEVTGNTPAEAKPSALAANVTEASEGERQQADVTINQDPSIGDQPAEGSGPRTAASDDYDDEEAWPYRKLQHEAKERTGSGGGTREEIVARLREAASSGGGGVDLAGGSDQNLGAETTDAEPAPEVPRSEVDPTNVENGGIQRTDAGQQHAEILQGLSDERRQQQLEAAKQSQQQG
jgi:hypothetical protein